MRPKFARGNPGRPKGAFNKRTLEAQELATALIDGDPDYLEGLKARIKARKAPRDAQLLRTFSRRNLRLATRAARSIQGPPRKTGNMVATGRYTPTANGSEGIRNSSTTTAIPAPIATSVHGSDCASTPSMTSLMSVA